YKFDILSQRGLGKIKDSLTIIRYNRPDEEVLDIHDIRPFKEDEGIQDMLRNAKAIGCFYVESPAMRMLLRKLQVDDYLGLVAASSVIRPGVARSGMMREYIMRFRFPEKRKEAHPILLDIMPDTFGVMVYQEDVIKVAHYFAGLDLGEADVLRRGMSGKFRSREEFKKAQQAFFDKAQDKGHDFALIKEVWRQVESFAGYAFAKGHSASYAVESYQSLYLKCHYPLEYMVATLNNFGGFYRTETYVHEARLHGAIIEAPCINRSGAETVLYGKTIVLGFGLVKAVEHTAIKQILKERLQNGPFNSLQEFVQRVGTSLEQLSILIRIGSFRFTRKDKKALLWEAHMLLGSSKKKVSKPQVLFHPEVKEFELPDLYTDEYEDAFDEIELLGFPLKDPFLLLREQPIEEALARELPEHVGKIVTVVGYMVTIKNTKTAKGDGMYFGTFLDRNGDWLDTAHFPPTASEYPFRGRGIYSITGTVLEEFGCLNVECISMEKLSIIEDPRYAESDMVTRMKKEQERSRTRRQ
ncbi:MAG: DNA polymerase III subunit alpha, partial [Flavobacteriales bacterium]|nr:DNA polymerase III subunit alpha [Flavobacteriales bacterium]